MLVDAFMGKGDFCMRRTLWIMLLGLIAVALPVSAHHGFQAEYDGSKIIYVTGTLTKVDWANPHILWPPDMSIRCDVYIGQIVPTRR